jgi:holo-[acyl-carrier protein] synthase
MIRNFNNLDTSILDSLTDQWNIGIDIVEIGRFQQLNYSKNKKFYSRIFTPNEIRYCLSFINPEQHFAANFAGKEAIYKAINMFCEINLNSIEILRNVNGAPIVNLHLESEEKGECLQAKVSLSHSLSYAIAFALVHKHPKSTNTIEK